MKILFAILLFFSGYAFAEEQKQIPRLVMFIGVDISGSFINSRHFEDSLQFLSKYIYAHLNGLDNLEVPHSLFVGALGGDKPGEAKTFYPIETFRGATEQGILTELKKMFPKKKINPFTDYNAFFKQIVTYVQARKLVLKPLNIIMISDGEPDLPHVKGEKAYPKIDMSELELLSRNVTVRLLYTSAVIGDNWQNKVKRQRIKMWTLDAAVMEKWKDPKILVPGKPIEKQTEFFQWVKNNVDFMPMSKSVN